MTCSSDPVELSHDSNPEWHRAQNPLGTTAGDSIRGQQGGMCVKLKFMGTRGYIEAKTRRHRRHSSLMISYYSARIMIDCGEDWKGRLKSIRPHAVVVTHGHPDHIGGLQDGVLCPVYATGDTWKKLSDMQIEHREQVAQRRPFHIRKVRFEAFAVAHSTRAPAVG